MTALKASEVVAALGMGPMIHSHIGICKLETYKASLCHGNSQHAYIIDCAAGELLLLMKASVTLKMDAKLLKQGRILAAEEGSSILRNLRSRSASEGVHVPSSTENTRKRIEDYSSWEIVANTPESILKALELESRCQFSFWDAPIAQAAISREADVLCFEDLADGQTYDSVRVMNRLK